jgi:hypothetical protein
MSAQLNAVTQTQKSDAIKRQTLSAVFGHSWSHYLILMRISNNDERKFYEIECSKNNWSVRELQRQLNSELYTRLTLSRDKNKVRELSEKGLIVEHPKNPPDSDKVVNEPLPEPYNTNRDLIPDETFVLVGYYTEWTLCLVQFYVEISIEKIGLTYCILGIYQSKFIKSLWTIYKLKLVL